MLLRLGKNGRGGASEYSKRTPCKAYYDFWLTGDGSDFPTMVLIQGLSW